MKKINSFILFGAAVFAFAACSNETQIENAPKPQEPVYETLSVKIGSEAKTRVTLEGTANAKSEFETGDKIAVWTEAGAFQEPTVDAEGKVSVDVSGGARSNYAVYYNGATAPSFESSTLKITLPSTYDYANVCGDKNPVPMVAKNDASDATNDMVFYAVCALARITLTGIPATADKLEVTFNQDVTGEFTVTNPGTATPSISTTSSTGKEKVTINLTPKTDYTGAVINIPVPVGTVTAAVYAKAGTTTLTAKDDIISGWGANRAHGKKATCAFTPSMYSMILAPGNLYTDEYDHLNMAGNCYDHIYAFSDNGDYANDAGTYSKLNRTHFNFNETYLLMKTGALSDNTEAYTNRDSYDSPAVTRYDITGGNDKTWRVPSQADWAAMTTGVRPGATLNATIGTNPPSSSAGWKFIKVVVSGMSGKGTSASNGTTALAADVTAPNTNYQAGLLLFPDNVEIDGTFGTLGTQNEKTAAYNTTTITNTNLNDLITAGCAFLPAVGCWKPTSFELVGTTGLYWSSTQSSETIGYGLTFNKSGLSPSYKLDTKSVFFGSVRLVRDLQ